MMIALYVVAAVIMSVGSLYLAWRNREFKEEHAPSAALRLLRRLLRVARKQGLKNRNERRYLRLCPLNVLAAERGLRFRLNVEVKDAILCARQFIFGNDERSSALP